MLASQTAFAYQRRAMADSSTIQPRPTFGEALRFWLKLGFISFGGPAGQIAIMHQEVVEKRRWVSEERFLHALDYCMILPGPEAQQLATYLGWLMHGTRGGLVAGILFVLPSALLLFALSWIYVSHGDVRWIAAVFDGLKPAVLALIISALWRVGGKALKRPAHWILAASAVIGLTALKLPYPAIIVSALAVGFTLGHWRPDWIVVPKKSSTASDPSPDATSARSDLGRSFRVIMISLVLWWVPVVGISAWLGPNHTVTQQGFFFSKTALVTFGGAYSVLPYVADKAVNDFAWLTPPQMMDGLALAETTPGPLIMVLQFVGFVGAWQHPGTLSPIASATLGAALTTWVTFVPCFLFIFAGAPYIERLRRVKILSAALSAVTAAVVGVILSLTLWFGWHSLVPDGKAVDWFAAVMAIGAFVALKRFKVGMFTVIAACAVLGVLRMLLTHQ